MKPRLILSFTFTLILLFFQGNVTAKSINTYPITTNPTFPADTEPVEIFFDATLGNGGLASYTGDVYAHTGVITNLSSGPSDWKYVKTTWGQNSPETKLERISTDLYRLTISGSIRQYYGVPAGEQIQKMAFVFRSGVQVNGSWVEGKSETGGDLFADVYAEGLFTRITAPSEDALLVNPGQQITIEAISNVADSMFMYINNILYKSVSGNILSDILTAENSGKHHIKIMAKNNTGQSLDSLYYFVLSPVTVAELPANIQDGINYLSDNNVTLCLYAPGKSNAFIVGDFNNWEFDDNGFMFRTPDGKRYWREIQNLETAKEYIFQYVVDGNIRIGDPYAKKVSDPWNDKYISESTYPGILSYPEGKTQGVATVLQTAQVPYQWDNQNFVAPAKTDLVIYELLVRDFVAKHDYQTLIDTLDYLKRMGVNAIELMPVNEFEGNLSWGYNPNYYFAPDKYYGHANDLKRFIDVCHSNGIAVILDMVLNHSFGTSPMVMLYWDAANNRPAANNPWFNTMPKHDFNVGFDFNHESPDTKAFVSRVVKYWLTEYKIDGYRFDLSKGFTQKNTLGNTTAWGLYDASRIAIWHSISDTIWSVKPDALVILEHFAENAEEQELAAAGMLIWGNSNSNFADAAKGASSNTDFSWASYNTRGWAEPNLISYMESHDEERLMYRVLTEGNITNPAYNLRDTTNALGRMQLANVFFYSIPGPKMFWQFGELGYDYTINYNGRTGEKPVRWDYQNDYRRHTLYNVVSELLKLKQAHNAFRTTTFTLDLSGYLKKIILNHADMSVVVLGNFNVIKGNIVPAFPLTGKWYDYFTGDSINVVVGTNPLTLQGGEYRLYTSKRLDKPETGLGIPSIQPSGRNQLLGQPYPNPSGSTFSIPLHLQSPEFIDLSVFDLAGRKIATIYNGKLTSGSHKFAWEPGNLNQNIQPGIYFMRLVTENLTETERLIYK